jgi:hypothetical protein
LDFDAIERDCDSWAFAQLQDLTNRSS